MTTLQLIQTHLTEQGYYTILAGSNCEVLLITTPSPHDGIADITTNGNTLKINLYPKHRTHLNIYGQTIHLADPQALNQLDQMLADALP